MLIEPTPEAIRAARAAAYLNRDSWGVRYASDDDDAPQTYVYLYERRLELGQMLHLDVHGFGQLIFTIDAGIYRLAAWAFDDHDKAWRAALGWDGDEKDDGPPGWWRCYRTGRRRPGGDPAKEYLQW